MILRVILISFSLILYSDIILCQEFDFLHLKDKSRSSVERAGDLLQIAIPIAGLGYTYYSDDVIGRGQFWKSYLSSLSLTYILKYTIEKKDPMDTAVNLFHLVIQPLLFLVQCSFRIDMDTSMEFQVLY